MPVSVERYGGPMADLVLTVIGPDRAGLVESLSAAVVDNGGNWERSEMARLGGQFAGIVLVSMADDRLDAFTAQLDGLRTEGVLDVRVEAASMDGRAQEGTRVRMELTGTDQPGIVHEVTAALAGRGITIDEFTTSTASAAMAGGRLFLASAELVAPAEATVDDIEQALGDVADELRVDIDLVELDTGDC